MYLLPFDSVAYVVVCTARGQKIHSVLNFTPICVISGSKTAQIASKCRSRRFFFSCFGLFSSPKMAQIEVKFKTEMINLCDPNYYERLLLSGRHQTKCMIIIINIRIELMNKKYTNTFNVRAFVCFLLSKFISLIHCALVSGFSASEFLLSLAKKRR